MWVAFALQKLLTFFSKKFQHICVSLDVNFNESLTNDVVGFEQLGPVIIISIVIFCQLRKGICYIYRVYILPKCVQVYHDSFEPAQEQPTWRPVCPSNTQISLYIHPVWQRFTFIPLWIAWRLKKAHAISEDTDQTTHGWLESSLFARLIVGFVVHLLIFFILSDNRFLYMWNALSFSNFCKVNNSLNSLNVQFSKIIERPKIKYD